MNLVFLRRLTLETQAGECPFAVRYGSPDELIHFNVSILFAGHDRKTCLMLVILSPFANAVRQTAEPMYAVYILSIGTWMHLETHKPIKPLPPTTSILLRGDAIECNERFQLKIMKLHGGFVL
jgi:hypothetical protein